MKSSTQMILPMIGTALAGGFYGGRIMIGNQAYALIVAPKTDGEHGDTEWIGREKAAPGAQSFNDGLSNTAAMAEAGSKLAQWAIDLRIGDFDDWYLPSLDEQEVLYRNLKPTTQHNSLWSRSGINLHAIPPTLPYTPQAPTQTTAELFQIGGSQAFEESWYWTSTRHASGSSAWYQYFLNGGQDASSTDGQSRARAVRRLVVQ